MIEPNISYDLITRSLVMLVHYNEHQHSLNILSDIQYHTAYHEDVRKLFELITLSDDWNQYVQDHIFDLCINRYVNISD